MRLTFGTVTRIKTITTYPDPLNSARPDVTLIEGVGTLPSSAQDYDFIGFYQAADEVLPAQITVAFSHNSPERPMDFDGNRVYDVSPERPFQVTEKMPGAKGELIAPEGYIPLGFDEELETLKEDATVVADKVLQAESFMTTLNGPTG